MQATHVPRHVHVGRDAPRQHPEDETERDEAHVEERHLLQPEAVGEVLGEVDERDQGKRRGQQVRDAERDHDQRDGHHAGGPLRDEAAGDRAVSLDGVDPVGLDIEQVVDRVDRPREQAEDARSGQGPPRHREVQRRSLGCVKKHVFVKDDGRQDEDVLHPLVGAQRLEERAETAGAPHLGNDSRRERALTFRRARRGRCDRGRPGHLRSGMHGQFPAASRLAAGEAPLGKLTDSAIGRSCPSDISVGVFRPGAGVRSPATPNGRVQSSCRRA